MARSNLRAWIVSAGDRLANRPPALALLIVLGPFMLAVLKVTAWPSLSMWWVFSPWLLALGVLCLLLLALAVSVLIGGDRV
jgi:uncharacterized protein (DUF983 family)